MELEVQNALESPERYAQTVRIDKLVRLLRHLSYHYYNTGEELVPDDVFDIMKDILAERDPDNKFLAEVGSPSKEAVKLPYYMGSLNKIKPETGALEAWKDKHKGPYIISDKLDGVSALLHNNNGTLKLYTRGDGTKGQDISHLIKFVVGKTVKIPKNDAIRGELIISKDQFTTHGTGYANGRNAVAGLVNAKHFSQTIANITEFVAYAVIHPRMKQDAQMTHLDNIKGLRVVTHHEATADELTDDNLKEHLIESRRESPYEIDGIVVIDTGKIYDLENHNPTYGFAFKAQLDDQMAQTTVKEVVWKASKNGYLKPKITFDPVQLVGAEITNATAFNAKYVEDHKLGPGAVVIIIRSGDVIPHIKEVLSGATSGDAQMPDTPYKWTKTHVDIIVDDIHGAMQDSIKTQQITFFFKTIGVKNISEGIVKILVDNGYDSVISIISGLKNDMSTMAKIEGIGQKILTKIWINFQTATQTIKMETLMAASGSLGRGMGVRKIKMVLDKYPDILTATWNSDTVLKKLLTIRGFDDITATQFADNLPLFKMFITELESIGINITHIKTPTNGNKFKDQKIVFTGFRDATLEDLITSQGGEVSTNVSKNTTLLVHKDSHDSSKYKKAEQLGIPIMTLDEFKNQYQK